MGGAVTLQGVAAPSASRPSHLVQETAVLDGPHLHECDVGVREGLGEGGVEALGSLGLLDQPSAENASVGGVAANRPVGVAERVTVADRTRACLGMDEDGPCSSYAPGSAPVRAAQRRRGA